MHHNAPPHVIADLQALGSPLAHATLTATYFELRSLPHLPLHTTSESSGTQFGDALQLLADGTVVFFDAVAFSATQELVFERPHMRAYRKPGYGQLLALELHPDWVFLRFDSGAWWLVTEGQNATPEPPANYLLDNYFASYFEYRTPGSLKPKLLPKNVPHLVGPIVLAADGSVHYHDIVFHPGSQIVFQSHEIALARREGAELLLVQLLPEMSQPRFFAYHNTRWLHYEPKPLGTSVLGNPTSSSDLKLVGLVIGTSLILLLALASIFST